MNPTGADFVYEPPPYPSRFAYDDGGTRYAEFVAAYVAGTMALEGQPIGRDFYRELVRRTDAVVAGECR